MDSDNNIDYKARFLQAEEQRIRAEERATREKEQRLQAEEQATQEKEQRLQAEDQRRQAEERNQRTSLGEFIQACHNLLSLPTTVQKAAFSTRGSIGKPTGKLCPTYLQPWVKCLKTQDELYQRISRYFQPTDKLFSPIIALEDIARRSLRPLGSEKDVEFHQRLTVEQHVQDILSELCKNPEAQRDFALGESIEFENHGNTIDEEDDAGSPPDMERSIPDQFCVHRMDGGTRTLITTVEYKPPHKLPVEHLRIGLRPMNLWEEIVQRGAIPKEENAKLIYNAEQITASTLVQEYHVMIDKGLEFSYITSGLAYVLLRVRRDDPSTLYYHLCEPNLEVNPEEVQTLQWRTAIARVLCLCLMSCRSQPRDQRWRNDAIQQLHVWETSLEYERSRIPKEELKKTPPGSDHVPSSPLSSPTADDHRPVTRSQSGCAPKDTADELSDPADSDSDSQQMAPARKRNLSQLTASPPSQQARRQGGGGSGQGGHRQHTTAFCTQKCLLGLQRGDKLDERCPNVESHREPHSGDKHPIDTGRLVGLIKKQLDADLDQDCTPFGRSGTYGAPFRITCRQYGYTIVGKGTTSYRWGEVRREAEVYRVLQGLQGSAVPVFLGCIDLEMTYHLHGAGSIRHMLLMGWGGEDTSKLEKSSELSTEIRRSEKEIRALGVRHLDFRRENVLWNPELGRALIIDFHRAELITPLRRKRLKHSVAANKLLRAESSGMREGSAAGQRLGSLV